MRRYGTLAIGILTLAAVGVHPIPWCIGCETNTPFGHVYAQADDVIQVWLVAAPFFAGLLRLDKSWLSPFFMVAAQLMAQLVGGEPWLDFAANEGPLIVLFGLPVCFYFLLTGYGVRYLMTLAAQHYCPRATFLVS
jgi:hypothetical protein